MSKKPRCDWSKLIEDRRWTFGLVFVAAMLFAIFTNHIWEDYFITFRASKNLAMGNGLVFTVGQKVHTFTSPLGVLFPALCSLMVFNSSDEAALWLFRIISCGLLGATAVLMMELGKRQRIGKGWLLMLLLLYAFDPKIVDFSINGMETAFVMFFFAFTLHSIVIKSERPFVRLGIGWAGLMWSRPDSCIYIALMGLGFLMFLPKTFVSGNRKEWFVTMLKAAGVTTVLYLPWFLWAAWYYGSPVPHTVTAKGLSMQHVFWGDYLIHFFTFPFKLFSKDASVLLTFWPTNAGLGGWHYSLLIILRLLASICALLWLCPLVKPYVRALSFMFYGGHFYITYFSPFCFAWYLPMLVIIGWLILAQVMQQFTNLGELVQNLKPKEKGAKTLLKILKGVGIGVVSLQVIMFLCAAWQMAHQQRIVENGNRKQIGLYLKENSPEGATVFLEPLGYIGFYSNLKMYDFPGLCSPEMIEAREAAFLDEWGLIIKHLDPTWVVVRPMQDEWIRSWHSELLEKPYERVKVFDVTEEVKAVGFLPGRNYVQFDQTYHVYRRNPEYDLNGEKVNP